MGENQGLNKTDTPAIGSEGQDADIGNERMV